MRISDIRPHKKITSRVSIYIDGKYALSLDQLSLSDQGLKKGQEIDLDRLEELKNLEQSDKIYFLTLSYVSRARKTRWQVETYLKRKKASPALTDAILNKLSNLGLINDEAFALAFVNDHKSFSPASINKIRYSLRAKHIKGEVIDKVLTQTELSDKSSIKQLVEIKRRQTRYQDDLKLMQYLSRQGYSYSDIKDAVKGD
ncbi:MAG TPA: RecX family transcriptional regulator [Candidatus Sulfotelmatobacter sp.]|nr:RecX family transcriptional regulator [Candidatus Sulfotelmatobacter sp.]